ncbi:MAG: hypothetical protein ABR537_03350, partial [Gemmatimonadales bacterium]
LYLKQGHQQDALRVYQALLAQKPHDAKLRNKVEQLSPGGRKGSGVSAQAFLKGIWAGRATSQPEMASPPPEQSTLAAAFDSAGPPPPGEPSHPAQDHISLDSVFGDEAVRRTSASQGAAPENAGGAESGQTGGFSFDEFFAGGKGAGAPGAAPAGAAESAKTPGGGRTSGRTQRPPEDEAEADQFQQWLKKLKS